MSADCQFNVGDPIPYVLTKTQLSQFTGYSFWAIDQFRRNHDHPGIKQLDAPGHPRFCGRMLKAWLDSQPTEQPSSRRFFGGARKRPHAQQSARPRGPQQLKSFETETR